MNIGELIEKLKGFPPEMEVLVDGYEDGYDPISSVRQHSVVRKKSYEWFNGEFDDAKTGTPESIPVLVIGRPHRIEDTKEGTNE